MTKACANILGESGPIAEKLKERLGKGAFESRPEQIRMAEAVERTLEKRERLLVEAGTGVGKSFAYLVPAMLRAMHKGEKVVIATATIALQEQLIAKDIPLLLEAFGSRVRPTDADDGTTGAGSEGPAGPVAFEVVPVLAKGRGNYLSIRRLRIASQRQDSMIPDAEARVSLHVIEDWAKETEDGSLSTLPALNRPEVWDFVRSDSDNCMGRKCAHYKQCFYQTARRELEKANIIVCNHALFFSDLALRVSGGNGAGGPVKAILPNYDHVIFDEAHNIEDAACEHFGLSLTMPRVLRLLRTLYSPRRRKGYLLDRSLVLADTNLVDRAITHVQMCERACAEFFEELLNVWHKNRAGGGRIRAANVVENDLTPAMRELAVCLRRIRESIEQENERMELHSFAKRASEIADVAEALVGQTLGDAYAYWVEVEGLAHTPRPADANARGPETGGDDDDVEEVGYVSLGGGRRRGPRVTIACAPIEVSALLKKYLFDPEAEMVEAEIDEATREEEGHVEFEPLGAEFDDAPSMRPNADQVEHKKIGIVLTSATLATRAIGEDEHPERAETAFAHVMGNLGVSKAATLQLGSPFDYAKQARVIVDLSVPDPKFGGTQPARRESEDDAPSYAELLSRRIQHHVRETEGGAFVLFTSFATMNACADRLKASLGRHGHDLFVQGRDGSRQMVLKRFLEADDGVLFGAASFWQGVDVRGERLRNVIITRLPFEPPDRPLVQARNERIEIGGGNPFMQDSLPRAIIRFKQGFGRLIRSKSDRGRVVVLDPRIRTARYGRMFLQALPPGVRVEHVEPDEVF